MLIGTASRLVSHWLGGRTNGCRHWVVGGIFRELATEGAERGIALLPRPHPGKGYSPFGWNAERGGQLTAGVPFDPFAMSGLLDEKMAAAGVTLLYLTPVVDVMQEDARITHLVLHNKRGFSAVPATLVVDATGDADVAVLSGCETVIGRRQDRLMTPVTLQVHMDGIDQEALAEYINGNDSPRFLSEIEELRGHQAHRGHPDSLPHPAAAAGAQSHLSGPGGERGAPRARTAARAGAVHGHGPGGGHRGLPGPRRRRLLRGGGAGAAPAAARPGRHRGLRPGLERRLLIRSEAGRHSSFGWT